MIEGKAMIAVLGPTGPAALEQGDPLAVLAAALGRAITNAGYGVMVCGVQGVARYADEGAREAGTEALVVPMDTGGTPIGAINAILDDSDACILLPGDLNAMAVLTQIWAYGQQQDTPFRPAILLGSTWPGIVQALAKAAGLDQRTRAMVTFATEVDEAVESLRYYIGST